MRRHSFGTLWPTMLRSRDSSDSSAHALLQATGKAESFSFIERPNPFDLSLVFSHPYSCSYSCTTVFHLLVNFSFVVEEDKVYEKLCKGFRSHRELFINTTTQVGVVRGPHSACLLHNRAIDKATILGPQQKVLIYARGIDKTAGRCCKEKYQLHSSRIANFLWLRRQIKENVMVANDMSPPRK